MSGSDPGASRSMPESSAPEVHLQDEGLQMGLPQARTSQPGLEVVAGPRVVSPEDKHLNSGVSWQSQSSHKKDAASEAATIAMPTSLRTTHMRIGNTRTRRAKIWGLQRRTFIIVAAIAVNAIIGIIVGVTVGLKLRRHHHPTPLSAFGGQSVTSSSLSTRPVAATAILSSATSNASALVSPSKTSMPPAQRSSPLASMTTITTGDGQSRDNGNESTIDGTPSTTRAVTTAFVGAEQPLATNTIPSQPTASDNDAPPSQQAIPSSPSSRDCIGDDGSTYTDPGTGDRFRLECAVSHQGKDIVNLKAYSMESCVSMCTKLLTCKGVVWYNVGPQGTDLNYCWLKSEMSATDIRDTIDAQSAVRL